MGASGPPEPDSSSPRTLSNCELTSDTTTTSSSQKELLRSSIPVKRKHNGTEVIPANNGLGLKSQIFDIWVGSEPVQFSIHEHYLTGSLKLKSMCTSSKLKRGNSKMAKVLSLPKENSVHMGYLFEYLYFDTLDIVHMEDLEESKLLANLYALGCRFKADDFTRKVVVKFEISKISSRIPPMVFLKLVEDIYFEENSFYLSTYFAKIAPGLINALEESDFPEIERMISEGGKFASALFVAFRKAFGVKTEQTFKNEAEGPAISFKTEPDAQDGPESKKAKLLPEFLETSTSWTQLPNADKMLVRLRAISDDWSKISDTLEKVTGELTPIAMLMNRHDRIATELWRLHDGDVDHLLASKATVEAAFEKEKWGLIAEDMVAKGAARYPAEFLQRTFIEAEEDGGSD